MSFFQKIIAGNFVYLLVNTLFFLFITPISIRVMGDDFFGVWSLLNALVIVSVGGTLGVGTIVNKMASEAPNGDASTNYYNRIISSAFLVASMASLLVGGLGFGFREVFVKHVTNNRELQLQLAMAIPVLCVAVLPRFLSQVIVGFLLAQFANRRVRQIETVSMMALWIGGILLASYSKNALIASIWILIVIALSLIWYFRELYRLQKFEFYLDLALLKRILNYAKFTSYESIANIAFAQFDRVLIGAFLGIPLVGVYSVATSIGLRVPLVVGQITEILLPYASKKSVQKNYSRLFVVFRKASRAVSLLVFCLVGILALWMAEILSAWISPEYAQEYGFVFSLVVAAYGLVGLVRVGHQTVVGMGMMRFSSILYTFAVVLTLAVLAWASSLIGLVGAALANFSMGILLFYNLKTYSVLGDSSFIRSVKNMVFDIGLGLCTCLIIPFLTVFAPSVLMKFIITLFILGVALLFILKDKHLYVYGRA
ncbi:MAG: lipopolysaccharide biosynthesis protein [Anaerolineales bacterium]|nr:lipopolysaccharide biosynthesis protein [Anaerolineales bacterium]